MKTKPLKAAAYICRKTHRPIIAMDDRKKYAADDVLPEPCSFNSSDPVEFTEHVKVVHGGGRRVSATGLPKLKPEGYAPRQTKQFAAEGLQVGADITWREAVPTGEMRRVGDYGDHREVPVTEWVARTGQVWSLGAYPRSAWVIPYDEIPDEAELAVLVREDPYVLPGQPAFRHDHTYRSQGRRAA